MATVLEPITMSDDLWHALGCEWPDSCRVHRCWTNECPVGAHRVADRSKEF
ncbi:hypothetical protein [Streptomyces sp. NPDC056670]|uniref:hypothetical protein n=1 Tax=Streptomyces sp. NPDC056670 TaxID=3345904 RepID=UPI0036AC8E18